MRFTPDSTPRKATRPLRRHAVRAAATNVIEQLERRQFFTQVGVGQIGVFEGPDGTPVRINVTGSGGTFDFIGATRDENGQARLNEIPMTIFDADGRVVRENLGGYGGRNGVLPVDAAFGNGTGNSIFDSEDNADPFGNAPSAAVSFGGLAANRLGRTYGVNSDVPDVNVPRVQVARIDPLTASVDVQADISGQILAALRAANPLFQRSDLLDVIGADFPLEDANRLFFAMNVNFPTSSGGDNETITRKETPAMFVYNVSTRRVTLDRAFFGFRPPDDTIRIDDFTFVSNNRIAMFGSVDRGGTQNGGEDPEPLEGLFFSDANRVVPGDFQEVRIGERDENGDLPEPTTELAAIEYIPGEDYLIAVDTADAGGGADDAQLLRINVRGDDVGRGRAIGPIVNPDQDEDVTSRRGENVADLAWNSRVTDRSFQPGKRGVLLGAEGTTDQLLGLDSRERFPNTDLYAIYGEDVEADTSVSISVFEPDDDDDLSFNRQLYEGIMDPFGGGAGAVRTNMVRGRAVNVNLNDGGLYLGIRTPDPDDALTVPVLGLDSDDRAGAGFATDLPDRVAPGVYVDGTMRDFFFGGTITGRVNLRGSVDTFYAGNVITGDPLNGRENHTDNFFVNGDARNIIVRGGIGTLAGAPDIYAPGTDFHINGRVQAIKTGVEFRGSADVLGRQRNSLTLSDNVPELEVVPRTDLDDRVGLAFEGTGEGGLSFFGRRAGLVDGISRNDTFATAQVLGTYYAAAKSSGTVRVNGTINNGPNFGDAADFYAVPMLAGGTLQVQLNGLLEVQVAVIDPDGRIYAQDVSNQNALNFLNRAIQVKADKPGLWRIAVTPESEATGFDSETLVDQERPYTLVVERAGDVALGGIVSQGAVFLNRSPLVAGGEDLNGALGLRVRSGDLGAIVATGRVEGADGQGGTASRPTFANPIVASTGNVRSVEGSSLGRFQDELYRNLPNLSAPRGSIGLIRANANAAADAFIYINNVLGFNGRPVPDAVVGGDIQVIETIGDFSGNMSANGGMGVIRVGSFGQNIRFLPGYLEINRDNVGTAELGLIDVAGDFGTFTYGGPAIRSGDGGNVRYLRVGGRVFRDYGAGAGTGTVRTGSDRPIEILDDSGARITIRPYAGLPVSATGNPSDPFGGSNTPGNIGFGGTGVPNPFGNGAAVPSPFGGSNNGNLPDPDDIVGDLAVSAYPTRSSGSVIYSVQSSTGVIVDVQGAGSGRSGDIGVIRTANIGGLGTAIINPDLGFGRDQPSELDTLRLSAGRSLDVLLTGGRVNVFEIGSSPDTLGEGNAEGALANFTRVLNDTDGEIVNLTAGDVGALSALYLGVSRPVANVKLEGLNNADDPRFPGIADASPFNGQRNLIFVNNAIDIRSRGPIGNVAAAGVVQNLEANSDNVSIRGVSEGIVGPIFTNSLFGGFRRIDIGEGLATSGSGNVAFGGIYSNDYVGLITNENGRGDVRGDILAANYLEGITLTGGSIIDADIYEAASLPANDAITLNGIGSESFIFGLDIVSGPGDLSVLNGIGDIRITGNGGILNSRIVGYNMGTISIADSGFGMVTTTVLSTSGATMEGASVGGLGIRGSVYSGGSFIGNVAATGTGRLRSVAEFAPAARVSDAGDFDAAGISPNAANDLNLFLGTTARRPRIAGVTEGGVIENTVITAARSVESVSAYEFRGSTDLVGPRDDTFPMQINFADSIGTITARRDIDGLRVIGGSVGTISAGRDIAQFQLEARNRVRAVTAGRNMPSTSRLNLTGNGSLDLLKAGGNVNASVLAAGGIGSVMIGGNLGSGGTNGGIRSGRNITLLQVGGDLIYDANVRAEGNLTTLTVRGDVGSRSTIRADDIGTRRISGQVRGDIIEG